jgi:hypothetical protein
MSLARALFDGLSLSSKGGGPTRDEFIELVNGDPGKVYDALWDECSDPDEAIADDFVVMFVRPDGAITLGTFDVVSRQYRNQRAAA